jgi:hypothetical protein
MKCVKAIIRHSDIVCDTPSGAESIIYVLVIMELVIMELASIWILGNGHERG